MRDKYEDINDRIWLDAKCDEAYYNGKIVGSMDIDNLLDECKTEQELREKILDLKHTAEASRDASEDEGFAYYDGEVAAYRELLGEMGDDEDE